MGSTLFKNISQLVNVREESVRLTGSALADLPRIPNAYLLVEDKQIAGYGRMEDWVGKKEPASVIDCHGRVILPAWCDSHTHLVFAGSREAEFEYKIRGMSYAEINARGGGILQSARLLQETSEDRLFNDAWARLESLIRLGTGAIEIKSGYGLTVESELKMLRVTKKLKQRSSVPIRASFLGAHTYPLEYRSDHDGYLKLIIEEMLPVIAGEKLADYIDVFCEQGFFSPEETASVCTAAAQYGLKPKLHVNQLSSSGGIEAGIKANAVSLDHLETVTEEDIERLKGFDGMCTLLPTAAFFLRMNMPPARRLIESGVAVALATDFNPGSSPSGNMNLVVSMACIQMKMLPEEAINAATIQGAFAMELGQDVGSITVGKTASLIVTNAVPSIAYLPYAFGTNLIDRVMIAGEFIS